MTISDYYDQYQIPPQLALHMLRVTAVGQFVLEHWTGEYVPEEAIILALLLHDMGNIVKFKRPFMGDMAANATKWEVVQDTFTKKYGQTAHDATMSIIDQMLRSVPASQHGFKQELLEAKELMNGMGYAYLLEHGYTSWTARILDFADMCVSPEGIVGVDARLDETVDRYGMNIDDATVALRRRNVVFMQECVSGIDLNKIETYGLEDRVEALRDFELF